MQRFTVPCVSISVREYRTPLCLIAMCVGLGLGMLGCGSPKMEPLSAPTRETFRFSADFEGLEIAVDPYFEAERIQRDFGANLLSHGIVPIRVWFHNAAPEGAYLLQPESVVILEAEGTAAMTGNSNITSDHAKSLDLYGSVVLPGSLLFSPLSLAVVSPLGFALDESGRDAADVARYMEYVRFQDRPLYPSDSNNGFVYFHLSSSKDLQRVSGLRFEIRNLRSQEATPVFIAFKDNSD